MKVSLAFLFLVVTVAHGRMDYSGHMIVRAKGANILQVAHLRHLQETDERLDFWSDVWAVNRPVDIHVLPGDYSRLVRSLDVAGVEHHVKVADLERALEEERLSIEARQEIAKTKEQGAKAFDFENYHNYTEIVDFLNQLALENPLVSVNSIAQTYEGRDLAMATISTVGANSSKPLIVIECGVHAREWAAPSTCLWFINELATKYGTDNNVTRLLDGFDWKISPATNPDGYTYSWSTDRLWRKNRRPGTNCFGVDINRNFDVNWGGPGSSSVECVDVYHGPSAFSEEESKAVRDVLAANRGRVKAAISIHTYSQLWMSPYGYTSTLPADYDEMYRVMAIGVRALQDTYGTQYQFGNHADTIYVASGVTVDHAYDVENIIYSYLLELRDTGDFGFQLPPEQIMPTAVETWNGIKAMALEILNTI